MANKSKKTASKKSPSESTPVKVTRIKAVDAVSVKKETPLKINDTTKAPSSNKKPRSVMTLLIAIKDYFVGAWFELRQVRWPDRKATWSLTAAVLLFTAFFIVLIVSLDALFKFLFQQILG